MRLNTDNFTLQFYTITSVNIYGFTETYRTDLNFLRNMNKIKEIFIIKSVLISYCIFYILKEMNP